MDWASMDEPMSQAFVIRRSRGAGEKVRDRSVRLSTVDTLSMKLSMNACRPLTRKTAMTGIRSAFPAPDSPDRRIT
jgi:hypothetical protein